MKTKRLLACFAAIVMLAMALPLTVLAETYATVTAVSSLHLRAEPRTDGEDLGLYRFGTRVEILNSTKYRNWAKVRVGGKTGYMYKAYLSSFTTTSSSSSSKSSSVSSGKSAYGKTMTVTSGNGGPVNLRRRGSTKAPLMARMPVGSKVTVLEYYSGWTRIRYKGKDGWVMTKFLK